ncbi:MAG: hypothetical protein II376_05330, partial [Clostridia bacterium]|nr:hypothetical protein [Clostridia bacterium]
MPELAIKTDVSQGSIINFCKKYAGGGFPSLKLQIAEAIKEFITESYTVVEEKDTVKDVLIKTASNTEQALRHTKEINSEKTLKNIAD